MYSYGLYGKNLRQRPHDAARVGAEKMEDKPGGEVILREKKAKHGLSLADRVWANVQVGVKVRLVR